MKIVLNGRTGCKNNGFIALINKKSIKLSFDAFFEWLIRYYLFLIKSVKKK